MKANRRGVPVGRAYPAAAGGRGLRAVATAVLLAVVALAPLAHAWAPSPRVAASVAARKCKQFTPLRIRHGQRVYVGVNKCVRVRSKACNVTWSKQRRHGKVVIRNRNPVWTAKVTCPKTKRSGGGTGGTGETGGVQAEADQGLVAAYGFEEGSGSTVVDSSGNGNTGSLVGAARASGGVFGDALSFDGGSARVVVPDSSSLHLGDAMTLEAWVKPAEVSNEWRDVVYKGDDNYYLEATSDRQSEPGGAATFDGTGGHVFAASPLPVDSWTHLAVTYDGATLRLYLNGDEVAEAPQTGAIVSSTHPLELGGDSIYGQYFHGLIDEVRVYNVARSAAEIQTDMSTPIVSGTSTDSTPPSAPGTLTATASAATRVDLAWGASTDNVGVTGYQLERCEGAGCSDFTQIATPTGTSYTDASVSASTSYSYRVRAIDAAGNTGPYSNTTTTPTAPSGLVAAYGFEEGSGSTVVDSSGNGNTGSLVGAARASGGVFGDALSFDGGSARVVVPDSSSLHLGDAMTLEAWVKPAEVSNEWRDVVYKGDDNYYLEATSDRQSEPGGAATFDGTGGHVFAASPLPVDSWTHLAVTYDGATLRLYLNGDEVAEAPQTGAIVSSTHPLELGGDSIYGQYFHGLIDEVRVYNVARSAAEIQTDMSTPIVSGTSTDSTPPSAPGTLTATASAATRVDLAWGASTDNVGVTGYQLERCEGEGCSDFTQIATPTGTSYTDASVSASTSYSYRVRAIDAAGNTGPYSNAATTTTPTATAAGPGPLHVDPTGRYLVDQNGRPFLMTGDSPQALIGNLTESDAALFFSTRRAQGFNTVWINLLCNNYTGCRQDGETWDGIPPFTTPGDLSTPNEAYFSRVDRMVQLAAQYGFVVLLDPAETGGWLDTLIANGVEKDRAYGQYLGRRYGGFSNIIWMSGNDYQTWGPDNDPYVMAVAQGIRDTDPSALQTVELNYLTSASLDDPAWAPLIDLNASYTYDPTYVQLLNDYDRSNFLPTFFVEGSYEDEQNVSTVPAGTPQQLRRQEYWSLLSGATGQLFGNHYTWQFLCSQRDADGNCIGGWKDRLASPGATQMANVVALLSSRPWYRLVPDQDHTVVTSGYGSFGDDDYVTAARTPDGKLAIAYVPSARTITVDLGTLSGPVTARWYDPTNGTFTATSGSPLANHGSVSLATPGANADGANDWVLVLEVS